MKIFKRKFICFFILACSVKYGSAQVILDTIYVNEKLSISVRFPNIPSHWYWNPEQPPYDIESIPNSGFTVGSRTKFTPAAHLYVTVVKRSLHFLVMYKKNIDYEDYTQTDYDFTSLKKIDDRIKQREEEARNPVSRSESKTENKSENKSVSKKSGADNDDSYAYYTLLGSGDKKFKLQQYAEAKADYDKALKMRPDDQIAVQRISEVKTKLEEKDKKQKKQQDAYKNYMAAGEKSLKLNKLEEAKNSFVQALVIVEADKAATSRIAQIEEKEKLAKQNEELETNYSNTLADADKAFQKEDYEKAKALYNKALGYIKRPGPTEQIALIDKIAKEKADKEAEGKISKLKQKENEQKDKEEAAKKKKYYAALKDADGLFKDGDLAKAKLAYNKAQEIDSSDPWPRDQVNRINKLMADQDLKEKTAKQKEAIRLEKEKKEKEVKELENRYNIALEKADKFFKDENYAEAKPAYIAAMAIIKKPWPQDQVKKIDAILAEQAATAKAEKLRLEKEKIITAKYNEVIHSADAELSKNNYAKSKKLYATALGIKPLEVYPKQKLSEIQATEDRLAAEEKERKAQLAAAAELKKKYDLALSKAKSYFVKEDLENSLLAYQDAAKLKPSEQEPQNQVKLIQGKLEEIKRQNEIEEKYQNKLALADSLLIIRNYESAVTAYREAGSFKPSESYPASQIRYIQSEIKTQQADKEENDKREAIRLENEREDKFRSLVKAADKSVSEKNYEAAMQQYSEALEIHPEHEYAKMRYKISKDQLALSKKSKPGKDKDVAKITEPVKDKAASDSMVSAVIPQKQTSSPYEFQANPIPYSAAELKAKYPNIDFSTLPPEQPFNDEAVDSKENTRIFNEVLLDKPRLNIDDKSDKIKLICQGINFEDRTAYLKLLVQNNSDNDFLTGSMMLTWIRTSGSKLKMYPLYIYPASLPVIKPGHEAIVIYACKSYNIGNKEKLSFELNDRMNKIKLELNIKGSVYTDEFSR